MLTVSQYLQALKKISPARKSILIKLYQNAPFHNSTFIAGVLGYENHNAANLQIGNIGKFISNTLNIPSQEEYERKGEDRLAYFHFVHDHMEQGWDIYRNLRKAIEKLGWLTELADEDIIHLFTEETSKTFFTEGKVKQVFVNRYERDKRAVKEAEKIHGRICVGCKIDFQKVYGDDIKSIIHYHHIRALSDVKKEEEKDVAKDLIPLCPNCHSVVHSTTKLMSIEELRQRVLSYSHSL